MSEPVIICLNCHSEIKLTESLAAPLIEAGRKRYEDRFAAAVGDQLAKFAKQRQSIEAQVTARLHAEHQRIAGDENERARRSVDTDLRQKDRQLAELRQLLRQHDEKLAEAQADLIRKGA